MDAVYVVRDGENPELRYSLRSLENIVRDDKETVWIFGGAPTWINVDFVAHRRRMQAGSPYRSTREHIAAACNTQEVSDPFVLWNDDFYAMPSDDWVPRPTGFYHRGSLLELVDRFNNAKTIWARGMRETADILVKKGFVDPLSYDLHVPLIVYKDPMREALRMASKAKTDAIHTRTFYGNIADLGGVEIADPKMTRRTDPFPQGPWLSSGADTFRSTVEPVLRYLFPDPSVYEKG